MKHEGGLLIQYTKEQADRYISDHKHEVREAYRLNYHLMPELGWMNDPNGFIHYGGAYHLFYQHYPYASVWGPMHWGHAVSRDLISWEYLPVGLAPDMPYDSGGCFSGSAVEKDGTLVLMYTGHVVTGPDKDKDYYQTQSLAVSGDGVNFVKADANPVIGLQQIPEGVSRKDFRDPKVFERDGFYYAVLGSNDGRGNGLVLLYRSQDLLTWEFAGIPAKSDGSLGDNWECPDFFRLEGRDILVMSPQRVPAQGDDYQNLHSTTYMIGDLDLAKGQFDYSLCRPVDYGFDFYAPQTASDERGRRILIGWMDMWESGMPTQDGHHWAGAMTLPREVVLLDGDLRFRPVQEIEAYRTDPYELQGTALQGELELETGGDSYELQVEFEARQASVFGVKLRTSSDEETVVAYLAAEEKLVLNRNRSGTGPGGERRTEAVLERNRLALRIFVDRSSVEVFIQGGRKVMTARIYPGEESKGIKLFSEGESFVAKLRKWDLAVPQPGSQTQETLTADGAWQRPLRVKS
ncbi:MULTISPECIES: glycoside hydrolase family 32 protein [Paenibacillus]|uniref:glycoside hydrolase family 32 protein n=1 Tax=Paenibacillus TaxID=44249 RepID=UPI0022B90ED8|nr:glycoside hydrolase family 32 protein [Paenibacillus caseinilyticus]MCZ8522799.1 glycoside hydrolase family 32 protein [Paenibacillus caseinilyticus]